MPEINVGEIGRRFEEAINATLAPKLDALKGRQVVFGTDEKEFSPLEGWEAKSYHVDTHNIIAIDESAPVAAIDSSCIFIGDTEDGSIYAAKCGLTLAFMGRPVMHFKIGPVLFYINADTLRSSNVERRLAKFALFDTVAAKRMIRVRIERILQNEISKFLSDSLILVDGSLKSSAFEEKENGFHRIIQHCYTNNNYLLGISKTTKLKVLDSLSSLLMHKKVACYVDVESVVKTFVSHVVGRPLLAKFSSNGMVLRVDVVSDPQEPLGRLLTNDSLVHGYPETLRLAHHVSTFTRTDVSCIRSFIISRFRIRELMQDDVRRTLLGSLCVRGI
jgi:hypothetical protein